MYPSNTRINKIVKSTLRVEVVDRIRKMIIENQIKPGERIVETRLAKDLGVSQSPIREAIRELEMMGLVENIPYKGCIVKKLGTREIINSYQVRSALEMLSVRQAIVKMDETNYRELETLLDKMQQAARKNDKTLFSSFDIQFHRKIIEVADNALLEKMWEAVSLGQWTHVTTSFSAISLDELAKRHEIVLETIRKRDADGASLAMQQHISELMDHVVTQIGLVTYG